MTKSPFGKTLQKGTGRKSPLGALSAGVAGVVGKGVQMIGGRMAGKAKPAEKLKEKKKGKKGKKEKGGV